MVENSHIQITKGILKGFAFKTDDGFKVHYLDMKDLEIKEAKIKLLGSKKFYYNESNEKYLGGIETKFGEVATKIKNFEKNKIKHITLNKNDLQDIKNFFEYTFIRSEKVLQEVNKYSVVSKIIGDINHNLLIDMTKENKKVLSYFNEFKINIIINKTTANFVVPRSVYYVLKKASNKREMYIMPLNKKVAIAMLYKEDFPKFIDNGNLYYLSINDESSILNLNEMAVKYEKNSNNQFVVGELDELIRLREYEVKQNSNNKYRGEI